MGCYSDTLLAPSSKKFGEFFLLLLNHDLKSTHIGLDLNIVSIVTSKFYSNVLKCWVFAMIELLILSLGVLL
mgnify:CR=1 FL=1